MGQLKGLIEVLKTSHIELFYLLFMYGLTVQSTVVTQLIEDKICLNNYGFKLEDCLNERSDNITVVIKETSLIAGYRSVLQKLPTIVTTLFAGAWINNYPNHIKFIISAPCISSIIQIFILAGNAVFFKLDPKTVLVVDLLPWIFGTIKNTTMALHTYIVLTNPPEKRMIKFAAIDVASLTGSIAGQYSGGWLLDQRPWFPNQAHNYLGVFIVSLIFKTISLIFFIVKVPNVYKLNEKKATKDPDHLKHNLPVKKIKSLERQESENPADPVKKFISKVFSFDAIKKLFSTLSKLREKGRKKVLLLLLFAEIVLHTEGSFRINITLLFSKRAYGWSNYDYSKYHAIVRMIPAFVQLIGPRLLIHKLGVSDVVIGIMAIVSHSTDQFITGSWLATEGYIVATISGCLFSLFHACVRSLLSKIVDKDEVGGVFSLLSVFSALTTLFTDLILIKTFNATLNTYPGLCFHLCGLAGLVPFSVFLWIQIRQPYLLNPKQDSNVIQIQTDKS